jgi:hypothetical protein
MRAKGQEEGRAVEEYWAERMQALRCVRGWVEVWFFSDGVVDWMDGWMDGFPLLFL